MSEMMEHNDRVKEAAVTGVMETLLSPEYGLDWVKELVENEFGKDATTDDLVYQVDEEMGRVMRETAVRVYEELRTAKNLDLYRDSVES